MKIRERKKQPTCPLLAMGDVGGELLDECAHLHVKPDQVRGLLMVHRDIALRVHQALPCLPTINADGLVVCSLAKVCSSIVELLLVRHDASYWAMNLATIAGKTEDHTPNGSYL